MSMNRREFIGASVATVAACALPALPALAIPAQRHVFRIYDMDEWWDYSAESAADAMKDHILMNYVDAGVPLSGRRIADAGQVDDSEIIAVRDAGPNGETVTRSARQWADAEDGMICTTCGF